MATTPPPLPVKTRKTGSTPVVVSGHQKRPSCSIQSTGNVVKIRVNREPESLERSHPPNAVRINIGPGDMILKNRDYYYGYAGGSGQCSPSETPDSGTCSDADGGSPPPCPDKREGPAVTRETSDDEISCDSLNSSELDGSETKSERGLSRCPGPPSHSSFHTDSFYTFHINEKELLERSREGEPGEYEDTFAGRKYVDGHPSLEAIKSAKGTIRGVKNRVRAGIATFLHINTNTKSWQEKESGQVVVYTTTMGIVRETAHRCTVVRNILRTQMVKFVEKDSFMCKEVQVELRERMGARVPLPQVFIEGQYVGDADKIEKLNESGELRNILKPYKSREACTTCEVCGGYRLLPCGVCNGSKKSVHRNHFTTELVALKCMNCDEVGLVKCYAC